jgi:predicted acyltransferase
MPITQLNGARQLLLPARIFGENPLLAYILCFLVAPLIDYCGFGEGETAVSLRAAGQAWFGQVLEPRAASLLFGLCGLAAIFVVLLVCHRRRWILRI